MGRNYCPINSRSYFPAISMYYYVITGELFEDVKARSFWIKATYAYEILHD